MTDPFAAAVDALMGSALAVLVDFLPAGGTEVQGIPALVRRPDTEGDFGQVRVSHDVRQIELRVTDLAPIGRDPARDDQIRIGSATYRVQGASHKDQLGLLWLLDAYRS